MKKAAPYILMLLGISAYLVGAALIPKQNISLLKLNGIAEQECVTYETSDGDTYDDTLLIKIDGIGKILTYRDVYAAAIAMLVIGAVFGKIFFNDGDFNGILFANSVIGVLLILITTRPYTLSTILYWCGIVLAKMALFYGEK